MSVTVTGDGPNIALTGSGSSFTITVTTGSAGGVGGVTDHGALTGLADDDHPQYAKKASNLSDLTSASTARTNLGLGTAAVANTGTGSADVILGNDSRLTDARTPTSHVHSGADITSGTVGTARLGSGTANSSTFLRGDQTWATPAGGSVATDTIWDAAGDLAYGTGADAATRLALGSRGATLVAGATSPEWDMRTPAGHDYASTSVANAIAETINPTLFQVGNQNVLTSGRVYLTGIFLPKGRTITSISYCSATTALATGTHQWFTLCDSSYVTLRTTVNDTSTAWGTNTIKTLALSSTFTTTYSGLYYVGVMVAATTVPSLRGTASTGTGAGVVGEAFQSTTGQTTPPADGTTLSQSTRSGVTPWAAVS